jgi:E2F/DP family winged-helix DNA-binding domain/Transcription factor DP
MESYWNEYPPNIKYLIEDLEYTENTLSVLEKYIPTLLADPALAEIFKTLGYSDGVFIKSPTPSEALYHIKKYYDNYQSDHYEYLNTNITCNNEYLTDTWDVSRGIKEGYLKTYYDNKLQDLSEAIELGLNPFESEEASLNSLWSTPPIKCVNGSISTEESTPRHCRGLKLLTTKVKQIIYSKGFFSYKEVSDELVKELEITEGLDRYKEEKNILRRVYDALNVLIASEVVVKKGKKYVWQHSVSDQNSIAKKKLKKHKKKIEIKRMELQKIANTYLAVTRLFSRNKINIDNDVIRFPFIIVATEEHPDNSVIIESNAAHTNICMKFKKEIKLYGDVDVLQEIKMQEDCNKLPSEVQSLLKINNY